MIGPGGGDAMLVLLSCLLCQRLSGYQNSDKQQPGVTVSGLSEAISGSL